MEPNGLHGGLFSGIDSGMLGLEKPLHPPPPGQQQQQQQNPQNAHIQNQTNPPNPHHYPQMVPYSHQHETQAHQSVNQHGYLFTPKPKQQLSPLSDEDELGLTPDDSAGDGKTKTSPSPWQRMKWTDSMVKLLILVVLYIGDEAGSEGNDKKKTGALFQKKGKWKSVSRALMERGFYVSPQQCEDKFNDLNKRYKRVNEILGKGTACLVVENQSLLDTMDLSPKMKEEVKKLLNSKHLFFKEMCTYHNNCGHGGSTSVATGATHSPEVAIEPSQGQHLQAQQRCLHPSENAHEHMVNLIRAETEGSKLLRAGSEEEEEDVEDESDDDSDDDEEDEAVGNSRAQNGRGQENEDENDEKPPRKRPRQGRLPLPMSPLMQQLSYEVANVIQDSGKSVWEKKQWIKVKLLQLEEQQVSYLYQACELEKQRLKWVKFSTKKEREMERAKLENERRRCDNERMVLVVRQKELALLDLHHHHHHQQQHSSTKRSDPSSITGGSIIK